MDIYRDAAHVLDNLAKQKASIKTLVLGNNKIKEKKRVYAIVCESLKCSPASAFVCFYRFIDKPFIDEIMEKTKLNPCLKKVNIHYKRKSLSFLIGKHVVIHGCCSNSRFTLQFVWTTVFEIVKNVGNIIYSFEKI